MIAGLPRGLDTQLGKKFTDGVELSGGQWQRLALARAFMRERPSCCCSTSRPRHWTPRPSTGSTSSTPPPPGSRPPRRAAITVLVSHRFSTVRMADLIVVMHNGRVEEVGTHEDLLDRTAAGTPNSSNSRPAPTANNATPMRVETYA